jgi:hypothetical protein
MRRGVKRSGKPGANHLIALQHAHGKGDFKSAKTHALNYAKAVHSEASESPEEETSEPGSMAAAEQETPPPNKRAALAKLAMSRRKQNS